MMLTISLEKLHHILRKAVSFVEVSHLNDVLVQWGSHLEDNQG